MNLETLKKKFEREQSLLMMKYADKFWEHKVIISWVQRYVKIKGARK